MTDEKPVGIFTQTKRGEVSFVEIAWKGVEQQATKLLRKWAKWSSGVEGTDMVDIVYVLVLEFDGLNSGIETSRSWKLNQLITQS